MSERFALEHVPIHAVIYTKVKAKTSIRTLGRTCSVAFTVIWKFRIGALHQSCGKCTLAISIPPLLRNCTAVLTGGVTDNKELDLWKWVKVEVAIHQVKRREKKDRLEY